MLKLLAESAPAKINLFLRVTGRRADGYHELDSAFVPISLYDRVRVEVRIETRSSDETAIVLRCDRADLAASETNLASRAARAFLDEFGGEIRRPRGVAIDLHKRIPVGAGLGGGSSDAGAVLRMMAALFRVRDTPRLARVALSIGADVPFFLDPRTARVTGIGERIEIIESQPDSGVNPLSIVIAVPQAEVSTADVFRALSPADWSGPAPAEHLSAIAAGRITPAILQNDLAGAAIARCPEIARLKSALLGAGAIGASMTGSGGAVFGLFRDDAEANRAASELGAKLPNSGFIFANSLA
jgi:4-diphosphocytidyl-2-C-methyl-D-erythritol kinase